MDDYDYTEAIAIDDARVGGRGGRGPGALVAQGSGGGGDDDNGDECRLDIDRPSSPPPPPARQQ